MVATSLGVALADSSTVDELKAYSGILEKIDDSRAKRYGQHVIKALAAAMKS